MALRKEDFDGSVFTVHRGFSAKTEVNRTKTGEVHILPSVSDFMPYIDIEREKQKACNTVSPYFFVHPQGRRTGKHYTHVTLNSLWDHACKAVGIDIDLYSGVKHSTASQMVNEDGYNLHDVQTAGDWATLDAVRKYAKTETSRVKVLLERKGKVVLGSFRESNGKENG